MVGKNKNSNEAVVHIQFNEYLTSSSCSKVVVEIIKYLAYQKQQIPYPFEQLKLLVNKKKVSETAHEDATPRSLQLERHYTKAAEAVDSLENIFNNIEAEFLISRQDGLGEVEEVVILFGATPITPKDVFRIQLPPVVHNCVFDTPKPPSRNMMVHLLRCLLESEGLHFIVSQPVTTTNTFVFFKRKRCGDKVTVNSGRSKSWFLPRENFRLPQKGRQAVLRIECIPEEMPAEDFDSPLAHPLRDVSDLEDDIFDSSIDSEPKQKLIKIEENVEDRQANDIKKAPPSLNVFSNHLVFKTVPEKEKISRGNLFSVNESVSVSNNMQCLVGNVSGSIESLSHSMKDMQLDSCRLEINETEVNCIQWFEARVPLRGFKDYVVNGISAINA